MPIQDKVQNPISKQNKIQKTKQYMDSSPKKDIMDRA